MPMTGLRLAYSVEEAAEMLGIARSTAYELVARGELDAIRLGRRIMISRPTLEQLLGSPLPSPSELEDGLSPEHSTTR